MGRAAKSYAAYYTVAEWEHWQDQWELIAGVPYCMSPAPSSRHQRINFLIAHQLELSIKSSLCRKCKVYIPIDWQISEDTVVQPDILVVCKPIGENRLYDRPEIIFEILSPSTKQKDRTIKFDLYQEQKVPFYVLVNPDTEEVEIYLLEQDTSYTLAPFDSIFTFQLGECAIEIDFRNVWE